MNSPLTIEKTRLLTNAQLAADDPDYFDFTKQTGIDPDRSIINITTGRIAIFDPVYAADIFNENGEMEEYLKKHGVLLTDFGGDFDGLVFRTIEGGLKLQIVFEETDSEGNPIFPEADFEVLKQHLLDPDITCDSGSLIVIEDNDRFREMFHDVLEDNDIASIDVKIGSYVVGYEQWDTDADNPNETWMRNIVIVPAVNLI